MKVIRVTRCSVAAIVGGAVAVAAGAVGFADAAVIAEVVAVAAADAGVVDADADVAVAVDCVGVGVGVGVGVADAGKLVGSTCGYDDDVVKDARAVAAQRYGCGRDPAAWRLLSTWWMDQR